MIGVMTWGEMMPSGFPIATPQNSGNMVHARAPFEMFPNAVGIDYGFRQEGFSSFVEFVNARCSALILPLANTIRMDEASDARGLAHVKSLSRIEVPLIIFGLGAQAPTSDIDQFHLGPGMTQFVEFLSDQAQAVSVRGEFTHRVFERYGSTKNVYVTGCPSFYSRPEAFQLLKDRLASSDSFPRAAFAGSLHHAPNPKEQLYRAIDQDMYLIEPVNAALHQFYLDCINDEKDLKPAYFLRGLLAREDWNLDRLREYMIRRYQLFRDLNTWLAWNREAVDGTIGTRFHVNMASLLSGVPATWVVHDSRTEELCTRLSLPFKSQESLGRETYRDILAQADYGPMFDALSDNFSYFNEFLRAAGLQEIAEPTVV